jgi:putative transposase
MTVGNSLTDTLVIRGLDPVINWRGASNKIRVDNGPDFVAESSKYRPKTDSFRSNLLRRENYTKMGYIEHENISFREKVLESYSFTRVQEAKVIRHG